MKIGIYGYGNLGRGVELAIRQNDDAELVGIFTRREPASISTLTDAPVYSSSDVTEFKGTIDVMLICGGSATDLPEMTPRLARDFNVIDSYDCHAKISEHYAAVDKAANESGHLALISCGWDPGLFSIARLFSASVLPNGKTYTFWGRGVSQGHSDAIRRLSGVTDAREYTNPSGKALMDVRCGFMPNLKKEEMHTRECYVVAHDNADREKIERKIKTMPDYFAGYDTSVSFITEDEMRREHSELMHGGTVIRTGVTGIDGEHSAMIEYSLKLASNPEFTGSVLLAYARAVCRMARRGETGCRTVFDIAPSELLPDKYNKADLL